jgi:hypothetical protein
VTQGVNHIHCREIDQLKLPLVRDDKVHWVNVVIQDLGFSSKLSGHFYCLI